MSQWWMGIAPAEISVPCAGEDHRVRWEQGQLHACDHGDVDDERTLATLGGTPFECVELLGAWQRHQHDLRALVVGPRGGSDELHVDPDDGRAGGAPRSRRRRGGGTAVTMFARSGASPRGGASERSRFSRPDGDGYDLSDLIALVGLGAGFGERLVATVAAEWTVRLREGRPEIAEALPRLQAALYGRVAATLRSWLGEPRLSLELEMVGDQHPRSLARVEGAVHAELPFVWLLNVWSRDLASVQGRFCLDAKPCNTADGEQWQLTTVAPDLRTSERIELRIRPIPGA